MAGAAGMSVTGASAEPLTVPNWSKQPGKGFDAYGQPSSFEKAGRMVPPSPNPAAQGVGASRTPHHLLDGMITPSGLHFERSHTGIPDIDPGTAPARDPRPGQAAAGLHARSARALPDESRIDFLECGGNSGALNAPQTAGAGERAAIHGLVSCSEWTGVRLSVLLDEAGVDPEAKWILAEGADASGMSRSVPLAKAMDDACSRSTRTASACGRRTAIRCGYCCPASRAT